MQGPRCIGLKGIGELFPGNVRFSDYAQIR